MQRAEQVQEKNKIKAYIQSNKLRQLCYNLTRQLALHQPTDPLRKTKDHTSFRILIFSDLIEYLIDILQSKKNRRLVYVHSTHPQKLSEIAASVSNKFNFKLIDLPAILNTKDIRSIPDAVVNTSFSEAFSKVQNVYRGVVVAGYPNNLIQATYIQAQGFLPQRVFMIPYEQEAMKKLYISNTPQLKQDDLEVLIARDRQFESQLNEVFGESADILSENIDTANETITQTLRIRDKKVQPLEAPRILVLHPPYLEPSIVQQLRNKYCFNYVSLNSSLHKLKAKKPKQYEKFIRKHETFSKELQLAIIQTECSSVSSKSKGLILSGWPQNLSSLPFVSQYFIRPHVILVFFEQRQKLVARFNQLSNDNHEIFTLKAKPSADEFRQECVAYQQLVNEVRKLENTQSYIWSESAKEVMRSFESLIGNPKFYN